MTMGRGLPSVLKIAQALYKEAADEVRSFGGRIVSILYRIELINSEGGQRKWNYRGPNGWNL